MAQNLTTQTPKDGVSSPQNGAPVVVHNPWAPSGAAPEPEPVAVPAIELTSPPPARPAPAPRTPPTSAPPPPIPASVVVAAAEAAEAEEEEYGETIVVDRKPKIRWRLTVEGGKSFPLVEDKVLLGRKPATTTDGTQALAVPDPTRTLSKLHARLELVDGQWTITDLNSTNGVLLVDDAGVETLVEAGTPVAVNGQFVLGKLGMSIGFEDASS